MKDKKLEEKFNEYFDGVEVPADLAADAKKHVKKQPSRLPALVKYASAAACFLLCFAVVLTLVLRAPFTPASPEAPDASPGETVKYYSEEELEFAHTDAYAISKIKPELKFIEKLALSPYADVTARTANFKNGETAFIVADITYINGTRDDTQMFIEYANYTYEPLKDYKNGNTITFSGVTFYLTQEIAENGEPVSKVFTVKNGVKYYLNVTSSDTQSFEKYLKLIFG